MDADTLRSAWFDKGTTLGVTGTNGKTTTTTLLAHILQAHFGVPVFRATTVGYFLNAEPIEVEHDYDGFVSAMQTAYLRGARHAVLEMTSESLARDFAKVWPCKIGVFTNLTHDHLDAHESPEHYLASKAQLFVNLRAGGHCVLNANDPASELLREVLPPGVGTSLYASSKRADVELYTVDPRIRRAGTHAMLYAGGEGQRGEGGIPLALPMVGVHFLENALAAIAAAQALGVPVECSAHYIHTAPVPPGRFEIVSRGDEPLVVVDYAHTPDAIERTLLAAQQLASHVTIVFGAGGDRDRQKRPLMGKATEGAARVIITTDNPRSENPMAIAKQIAAGVPGVHEILLNREEAIRIAIRDAKPEHLVLLLGKGHEVLPVSDVKTARAALDARAA
jgi:UDP-N-acetylmuramoyl-L-alanyl-D-glutamate--2,6-diaminopimelate ligase